MLAAALAGLAGCDAPRATRPPFDYDPTQLTGSVLYRWPTGRTIAIFVDTTAQAAGFDIAAAARTGAALWNGVSYYREFAFSFVADPRAADVIVHYRDAPRIVDVMTCEPPGSGSGKTVLCPNPPRADVLPLLSGGGGHVKVDVYVDPLQTADAVLQAAGLTRTQAFPILIAHELGHVLGIGGHSSDPSDIMNAIPTARRPSARDEATLRYVLGHRADVLL